MADVKIDQECVVTVVALQQKSFTDKAGKVVEWVEHACLIDLFGPMPVIVKTGKGQGLPIGKQKVGLTIHIEKISAKPMTDAGKKAA